MTTYAFITKYTPWPDDNNPPDAIDSVGTEYDVWREMIYAKEVTSTDVSKMVKKTVWTSGVKYDMYTHEVDLSTKSFFVITDELKIFKCLDNAGVVSTVKPTFTYPIPFTTSDGYTWKYMYTILQSSLDKFGTATLMPLGQDLTVVNSAVQGAIDIIRVDTSGTGWISLTGTIAAKVSNNIFQIDSTAPTSNGYYNNSGLYITAGAGAGTLGKISSYVSNSSGNFVFTTSPLPTVGFGDTFYISPAVAVNGDGVGLKAYSRVDQNTSVVSSIRVVNSGNNYSYATATLDGPVTNTYSLTPILPPIGGHGLDPSRELGSRSSCVSISISNLDGDRVPSDISFRTSGLFVVPTTNTIPSEYLLYTSANLSFFAGSNTVPAAGEKLTSTSSTTATVLKANSTVIYIGDVRGPLANNDVLISNTSGAIISVSNINSPSLGYNDALVLSTSNFSPITRTPTTREKIKFIIGN